MSWPDPLDVERLSDAKLLARVEYKAEMTSTQERAHDIAVDPGARLPVLVVAERQSAGRGRGANRWWTAEGSLALSLLFDPAAWGLPRRASPERSLVAAVALVDAVKPLLSDHTVGLHWPNDVFADSRKLAGILIDVLPDGRHILGIGLNVNNSLSAAPDEVRKRATSLFELTGRKHDRTQLLLSLLARVEARFRQLAEARDELGADFHRLCLQIGHTLTVDVGSQATTGCCAGIGSDGALVLETDAGLQRFYSGVLRHSSPLP